MDHSLSLTIICHRRLGMMRMSSEGPTTAQFAIRFADFIFAEILDPNRQNPKTRRVVVLTPDAELVTGTLPNPITADYVKLPYKNPPGRHPKTRTPHD
jgi:hypothetical protein